MRVPPRWVRRLILAPAVVVLAALMFISTPVWLVVALILGSLVPRYLRVPRILLLTSAYLLWDSTVLLIMFVLWVSSGFGWKIHSPRFVRAHYVVGGCVLRVLFRVFGVVLRLRIVTAGSDDADTRAARRAFDDLFASGTPLVVASRHGGPGDSFAIVHILLNQVRREPRIVLKDTLQWDPAIDVLLSRIPTRFITPSGFSGARAGAGVAGEIGALAEGLDRDDALVIFPEGGQVSTKRRERRIAQLRASGREELAARGEVMRHVMPPQPAGVSAALAAAPDADMVFIAHTGLDRLQTIGDVWRELPMDKRLTMRAWRVPRADIPPGTLEQAEWLFSWFERIDVWVSEANAQEASGRR